MDIATLVGLLGAVAMIIGSMVFAGGLSPFVDVASVIIVFGGTFFIVMMKMPMGVFIGHFKSLGKAFKPATFDMAGVVERMVELAAVARKDGMMALEGQQVPDRFFERGLQMLIDGADEAKLVKAMKQEIKAMKARHEGNQSAIKAWIDFGPAMGMIGTLIGLVLMLGNMSDPKSIGPAMAVALLTTLYGALIANVLFGPILAKLEGYTADEVAYRELVIEGLRGIARGDSPRNVQEQMVTVLPPKEQARLMAA
ncbi:motility protein A [Fuscovulum ytuae]|uniref:MotA/TolQ/ExbB proton channel family protein n=1 Tax=Fuscovulum ytuae TaxID=3042299 RepID=A0ABY8Q274_9RHOB|nr:MotA/TolQ/ExbB proton channel family protein [Fuscovulum sp. YMD61]WGV14934.1 MotA/TolQ/ExbB proton channel family protein [Fuscovulum sp. YMD61]